MQNNKVRVLNFVGLFAIGGTERHVVNLVRELDSSRFELYLSCFEKSGQFLKDVESLAIPISEYKINSFFNLKFLRQQFRFIAYLRRNEIDVVHTYGFYTTVFAVPAAKLARVPVVIASIRDTGELLTPRQLAVQKAVCRLADSVLVNAQGVRKWLIDGGYRADKIEVIRNGIDVDRFVPRRNGSNLREELGLPGQAPLVAMLGRINRLKGVEYFLEAAASVSKRFPEVRFLIVGDCVSRQGAYKKQLKNRAAELGLADLVLFTGYRMDVAELLSQISLFVLPSLSEGLSNVLVEAMAAGAPAIATRVGGNPEVIKDGETGIVVEPADSKALADAMCRLLGDPELARRYGEAGRRRIQERFSLKKMVRSTEEYYLDLLERIAGRQPSWQQGTVA